MMDDHMKKYFPSSSKRKQYFIKNGSSLEEKLIATFGPRYELPIQCFSAKELMEATNNFLNHIFDYHENVQNLKLISGSMRGRSIIVAKHRDLSNIPLEIDEDISNIAMTSQLSHLKHVLKLVGCCLEFEYPILVYENVCFRFLGDFLYQPNKVGLLTWRNRLKIAKEISYTISYLHNAFTTPIIYGNFCLYNIIIDEFGVAKLFGFSQALRLPPGERKVKVSCLHINQFFDPNFFKSIEITQERDVYHIGILLLLLITGGRTFLTFEDKATVLGYVKGSLADDRLDEIVDSKISDMEGAQRQQLEDLVKLALKCTQEKEEERPNMISVTKELCRIEKI